MPLPNITKGNVFILFPLTSCKKQQSICVIMCVYYFQWFNNYVLCKMPMKNESYNANSLLQVFWQCEEGVQPCLPHPPAHRVWWPVQVGWLWIPRTQTLVTLHTCTGELKHLVHLHSWLLGQSCRNLIRKILALNIEIMDFLCQFIDVLIRENVKYHSSVSLQILILKGCFQINTCEII